MVLAVLFAVAVVPRDIVVAEGRHVHLIGWTRSGQLLYENANKVLQWPSGRTISIPATPSRFQREWTREPNGDRWANDEGVLDAKSMKFSRQRFRPGWQFWQDGQVGVFATTYGESRSTTVLWFGGRKLSLPRQWQYHGISTDGKYVTATKEPLVDFADIYVLRRSGQRLDVVKRYPKAVDDHQVPGRPEWNPSVDAFILNLGTAGGDVPFMGRSTMKRIPEPVFGSMAWLEDGSGRYLLQYMTWAGTTAYDQQTKFPIWRALVMQLELRDLKGRRKVLARVTRKYTTASYEADEKELPGGAEIEDGEVDRTARRLAFVEKRGDKRRLIVRAF